MNICSIIGNLTADVQLKDVGENKVADFSIAVNEVYYNASKEKVENVHYFQCVAWGKLGENIAKFFTKGQKIALTATLKQDRWEKEGEKRSIVKLNVTGFYFCGDKKGASDAPAKTPPIDPDDNIPMEESEKPF